MAEDDIYGNKARYERFLSRIDELVSPADEQQRRGGKRYYVVKNPANLKYFRQLIPVFEAKDLSYVRRLRIWQDLLIAAHVTKKDFRECDRDDVNEVVAFMHTRYKSAKSKQDFKKLLRYAWKILFPETDREGRADDTIVPYPVRHLKTHIQRSKVKMRNDRLLWEEFEQLVCYFADDPRIQAYLMLATESLGRPQEILTRKLKHIELHDMYAKVWLTERGKEGPGLLQCIDSFPYLVRWLENHPMKKDSEAPVFINLSGNTKGQGMTPINLNKHLRIACKDLKLGKKVTCYSLKRNGVTFRRLRGDTDLEIQHAARWTSTKQLKTYDLSHQEDAFQSELMKRGMVKPNEQNKHLQPAVRRCMYCGKLCGFTEEFCGNCKRPLSREAIKDNIKTVEGLQRQVESQQEMLEKFQRVTKALEPYMQKNPELLDTMAKGTTGEIS